MKLQLIIREKIVEEVDVPIDLDIQITLRQRELQVLKYRHHLRNMYYTDLLLTNNWEIVLIAESKMNLVLIEE